MRIIVPIGISGSGKSTLYKKFYSNYELVCPDQIRLELTGDISDQTKNGQVFKIVDQMVDDCIKNDRSFFYDATNVNSKYRKEFVKKVKKFTNVEVIYVFLESNIEKSYKRIQNDLTNGIVRSNVPEDVLKRQYNMYMESVKSDWKSEGADRAFVVNNINPTKVKELD